MTQNFPDPTPFHSQGELRDALAKFLLPFPWSWFVTLTFENPVSKESAHKKFLAWIHRLEALMGARIGWFRAEEGGNFSGCGMPGERRHYHALLICERRMPIRRATELWRSLSGYAFIKLYDPARDGVGYCTKKAYSKSGDFDLSENLTLFQNAA